MGCTSWFPAAPQPSMLSREDRRHVEDHQAMYAAKSRPSGLLRGESAASTQPACCWAYAHVCAIAQPLLAQQMHV